MIATASRGARTIAGGLALVVLVGLLLLLFGPARGMREDIGAQRRLVADQLATIRTQLALQQKQLDIATRQLAVAEQTRDIAAKTLTVAQQTRDLARVMLQIARATRADVRTQLDYSQTLIALAQRLEVLARDTDRHAANIDRKSGPLP